MSSLLSRSQNRLVVLPPANFEVPEIFRNQDSDPWRHDNLLAEMQRFRGAMYARDGAISTDDLTADGRHIQAIDDQSWHVLSLDGDDRVCACLRYFDETNARGFDELFVRTAALSNVPKLGGKFRRAVENGLQTARRMNMWFGEVGGWAVAEDHRRTFEPLRIILATFGLLRLLGNAIGVATATLRHESAPILRRIGLTSLVENGEELPSYFDPHYGCEMQVLQFDSRRPASKYEKWVSELAESLQIAPVVSNAFPSAIPLPCMA